MQISSNTQSLRSNFIAGTAALALAISLAACSNKVGEGNPNAVEIAPGTMIEMAAEAKVGMTVAAEITERQRYHYYRFENSGQKRDMIRIRIQNRSTTLNPSIEVFDWEQHSIGRAPGGGPGSNVELSVPVEAGKAIFVFVSPTETLTEGPYELTVSALKAYDANEDNNYEGDAKSLAFGSSVDGGIMDGKDRDWFKVTPSVSGKAHVVLENLSQSLVPKVTVFFGTSLPVSKVEPSAGASLNLDIDVTQGQEFRVVVEPDRYSDGKYRLTVKPDEPAPTP